MSLVSCGGVVVVVGGGGGGVEGYVEQTQTDCSKKYKKVCHHRSRQTCLLEKAVGKNVDEEYFE